MHSIVKVDSKAGIEIFSIYLIRSPQHSTHCIRSLNYLLSVKTGLLLLHYALYNCTGWSVRGSGALWLLLGRSGSATVATTAISSSWKLPKKLHFLAWLALMVFVLMTPYDMVSVRIGRQSCSCRGYHRPLDWLTS